MDIIRNLSWMADPNATRWTINEMDPLGGLTVLAANLAVPFFTLTIDNTRQYLWLIQAQDDLGNTVAEPIEIQFEPRVNLATIRTQVRNTINDVDGSQYRWPDDELNQYIREAIRDYTKYYTKTTAAFIQTQDQVRTYNIPDNFLREIRVDFTDTHGIVAYLKRKPWKGGDSNLTSSGYFSPYWKLGIYAMTPGRRRTAVGHYDIRDGQIELDFTPQGAATESLTVHYEARWTVPYSDLVSLDFPDEDLEVLVLYTCGKANLRVEEAEANLSRWGSERRNRADNPLEIMSTRYFNAYNQKLQAKQNKITFLRRVRV